jgi:urea transporter
MRVSGGRDCRSSIRGLRTAAIPVLIPELEYDMQSIEKQFNSLQSEQQRKKLQVWLFGVCFLVGCIGVLADQSSSRAWAVLGTAIPLSLACMFAADLNGIRRTIRILEFIREQPAQSNAVALPK